MSRLKTNSRTASTSDARITEMVNGVLVKPAKKIEEITEVKTTTSKGAQPQVWNLTKHGPVLEQESKAAFCSKVSISID